MKTNTFFSVSVSILFLISCTTNASVSPAIETPVSPSPMPEQPTAVEITNSPVPTSTNSDTLATIPICPKSGVQTTPFTSFGIPGTIIYQNRFQGLYTVGGNPLSYSKLPVSEEEKYSVFGFSPNGEWFAYSPIEYSPANEIIFESPEFVLLSANGERIEHTFSVKDFEDELSIEFHFAGFSGYSHWINNTTIYAALYSMTSSSPSHIDDTSFKVLDPFAGIWRKDLLEGLPDGTNWSPKGISPDLTRMLYIDDGLALRDLEKGIDIWHDKDLFAGFGALMFWSPDSNTAAYANLFDSPEDRTVVLISRDGVAKSIMGTSLPLSGLLVDDLRWSPDGRYIALLVWEGKDRGESVLIYDFVAEKYISRCPIPRSEDTKPNIIWSPDNKYLAYAGLDYPLIIMDVRSGELFQLAENARAVGWSDKFPVLWNPH